MARENVRPSESQVHNHYCCRTCGSEVEVESWMGAPHLCHCGGQYSFSGESYPSDPNEWAEERDDYHSDWHSRR